MRRHGSYLWLLGTAILAAGLAGCGGSSTGELRGRVVKEGKVPVAGSRLDLAPLGPDGEAQHRATNARGGFVFLDVKKGRYRLSVAYDISGVFECTLRFPVEILAGKTLSRRFEIPLVDVGPAGKGALPNGRAAPCRTLKDPLRPFLCNSVVFPILLYALPPRTRGYGEGYRSRGFIAKGACRALRVLGRLGKLPQAPRRPFGWLFVSTGGKPAWANPWTGRRLPKQLRAWQDVALAAVRRLPASPVTLGSALPDLAFTEPYEAQHAGDPCFHEGAFGAEWAVSVRNAGRGLGPKRFELFLNNGFQKELRHLGDAGWARGIAPGETLPIEIGSEPGHTYLGLNAYTRLKLDPDNKVKESDESNNELSLGYLTQLTCVSKN